MLMSHMVSYMYFQLVFLYSMNAKNKDLYELSGEFRKPEDSFSKHTFMQWSIRFQWKLKTHLSIPSMVKFTFLYISDTGK